MLKDKNFFQFRTSSLLLGAMSPMLREALLDSSCTCGTSAHWGGGASADTSSSSCEASAAAVVVVDERWRLSVSDLDLFFGVVFGERRCRNAGADLAALKRACLALQVRGFRQEKPAF